MEVPLWKIDGRAGAGEILVSDGPGDGPERAWDEAGGVPEPWCVEHEEAVREIARQYAEAGADAVETDSFGANRLKLAMFGLADRCAEINTRAARLSREAAGGRYVLGSIGPTGKMLLMGDTTEEELYEVFREQATALERGGADAACIETMSDTEEV